MSEQIHELHRTLVEACPDAVAMVDLNRRLLFVSQRAVEMYGAEDVRELVGRDVTDLVPEEERQRLLENFPRLLQEGVRRNQEYVLMRRNGTRFAGEVSAAVVRDADGRPRVLVAVIRDVTERKQAQELLRQERANLSYLLQSSDHERQLIAYEIHDGPAQQVAGALMYLQAYQHWKDLDADKANTAYDAAMASLRQGHFEIRRLISGLRPPVLDEFGVEAAVAQLVHEKSSVEGPRIEFHSHVRFGRLAPALENAIYRIVQETLTNACRHSQAKNVRMTLVQEDEEDAVRLEVRDDGIGFDLAAVADQRFGLKGIRERTRMLGGQCTVESQPGQGTRVEVVLPLLKR
jgi:PAS domain S-box-containing protein